jgi:hypothetical protein
MSQDVLTKSEAVQTAETEVRHGVRPQEILDVLVESVKRDSQREAAAFLAETTVPHGGE